MKKIVKKILSPFFYRFHSRNTGIKMEIKFWEKWLCEKGGKWREDFEYRVNPDSYVSGFHKEVIDLINKEEINVLDIGAGPLTAIGKKHLLKKINITAVDPLAGDYNLILKRYKIEPPVRTLNVSAEEITVIFRGRKFDWINAQNSLDHTADPISVINQIPALLSDNGVLSLFHEINEGLEEGYRGFHKWNFAPSDGGFTVWNPQKKEVFNDGDKGLKISTRVMEGNLLCIIKKIQP
ncbi:MAG: methyltransferase domain-containing protein [bacterium]